MGTSADAAGVQISDPNIKLQPGDLISVDPSAVTTLSPPKPNEASYKTSSKKTSPPPPPPAEADASLPGTSTPPTSMPTVALTANQKVLPFHLPDYAAPFLFIPSYLEMSFATCSAVYLRHPTPAPGVSEVPSPYEADGEVMRLAWVSAAPVRVRSVD
jgi:ribosomal protein S4